MNSLENLHSELLLLNENYVLFYRENPNSLAFILDTPTKVPVAIHRQICMKNEISILPCGPDKVNVIGNTVYLDYRTPNQNYHYTEILMSADLDALNIHKHIQSYIKVIAQKFQPSDGLGRIAGGTPKPIFWIREFVTCHIQRAGLLLPEGEIKIDEALSSLGSFTADSVGPDELEEVILKNSVAIT